MRILFFTALFMEVHVSLQSFRIDSKKTAGERLAVFY